jgi:hypothetical protein
MPYNQEQVVALSLTKIKQFLGEIAPVWVVDQTFRPREDSVLLSLVYEDASYGWINRRIKYDAFNDVLYHMGWRLLKEEDTLSIQEAAPFISGEATHVPNAPGHRLSGTSMTPR